MSDKLPCEMIQDLLPSYIEGLTSDVTNTIVEKHIAECEHCKNVLEIMKEPTTGSMEPADRKEIDFLKKTRKRTHRIIAGSILTAIAIVAVFLTAKIFFIGHYIYGESVACQVQVDGNHLTLNGVTADDSLGISSVEYTEENGVVTVSFKAVKESPFYAGEFHSEYTAENEITRVCLDSRILWDHGKKVSAIASAVFNTRHAYIGNMPENGQTVIALNMYNYLGSFTHELQTSTEPYGWTMVLEEDIAASQKEKKEEMMKSYAYVLMAVIDNLGEVSYEYTVDGKAGMLSVTEEEASSFAGQNIKLWGQDVLLLQELIEKTGLDTYSYVSSDSQWHTQETIQMDIVNSTDEEITGMSISYYLDGKLCGTQGGENADGTLIQKGETLSFTLIPADLGGAQGKNETGLTVEVSVYGKDGNCYEVEYPFYVSAEFGAIYSYTLSGNMKDGFEINQ